MENCYSNLMHDDGKGLLSLILSLIGLKVNPFVCVSNHTMFTMFHLSLLTWIQPVAVPDHHVNGPDERVLERDAAVRPAGAAVCWQESVGGGAAQHSAPGGQRSHHCDGTFAGSPSAGHQAGESHLQRWVHFISEQFRDDPEEIMSWLYQHQRSIHHTWRKSCSLCKETLKPVQLTLPDQSQWFFYIY